MKNETPTAKTPKSHRFFLYLFAILGIALLVWGILKSVGWSAGAPADQGSIISTEEIVLETLTPPVLKLPTLTATITATPIPSKTPKPVVSAEKYVSDDILIIAGEGIEFGPDFELDRKRTEIFVGVDGSFYYANTNSEIQELINTFATYAVESG